MEASPSPGALHALGDLPGLLARVRALGGPVRQWLDDPGRSDLSREAGRMFSRLGFATVPGVLPPQAWTNLVACLWPALARTCEEVTLLQLETGPTTLSDGARFRRIDPYCVRHPPAREAMQRLLDHLGLSALAEGLASAVSPLVREVAGPVSYRRFYFYLYFEDDYISAHNDRQVGDRVDVQFPVSLDTSGGIRVLSEGLFRMHYDAAGTMNILGPRVWHEVPPLLRTHPGIAPRRFNMGLRFTPDE